MFKTSPEKPDFSKSGVHGVNGPQGSWFKFQFLVYGASFSVYFGTLIAILFLLYGILKSLKNL